LVPYSHAGRARQGGIRQVFSEDHSHASKMKKRIGAGKTG